MARVVQLGVNERPAGVSTAALPGDEPVYPDPQAEKYIERLRGNLADQREGLVTDAAPRSTFYVFFSFDLVNSTLFKTLNPKSWPLVTQKFYEFVEDALGKRLSGVRLWKYVGDELLLYRRIGQVEQIRECLPVAYEVLTRTIGELHRLAPEARTVLSVKATVWCAKLCELPSSDFHVLQPNADAAAYRNILVRQPTSGNGGQLDFLGPEIDAGFRIAKFAPRKRIVISAELAYLLYRDRAYNDVIEGQVRIVAYEQLRGVWGNRHYPIIWYEPDWNAVPSSFGYDERFQSETVRRLIDQGPLGELCDIAKVFTDLDRSGEADELWGFVRGLSDDFDAAEIPAAPSLLDRAKEVHCVAVCFRADGMVLVAQRRGSKRRFPHYWEFGCGQLASYETFVDCLRRAYEDDFGAKLSIAEEPTPFRTYLIDDRDENRRVPGIIFIAEIENPEAIKPHNHDTIAWIDPDKPESLADAECVPGFVATLRDAVDARRRLRAKT